MKISVAGLGFMGATHLKALMNTSGVEVTAVASADPRQLSGDLSGVGGNIGGPGEHFDFSGVRRYRDWREAVVDNEADAVDICLPTNLHAPAAIAALNAGKHVLVEKPMALDGRSADAMIEAAGRNGRILMVAQVLRFFPAYRAVSQAVRSGTLGAIRAASFCRRCALPLWSPWLADKSVSGGGAFDLLVHDVDMCLHLFGTPEAVSAVGSEDLPRGIDWISAQLHYDGPVVVITGGWHPSPAFPFSMEYSVVGDDGIIEYNLAAGAPVLYGPAGTPTVLSIEGTDGYRAEVEYFVGCCLNGRPPDECPPRESAAAVKVAALMMESRARHGERLTCNL